LGLPGSLGICLEAGFPQSAGRSFHQFSSVSENGTIVRKQKKKKKKKKKKKRKNSWQKERSFEHLGINQEKARKFYKEPKCFRRTFY